MGLRARFWFDSLLFFCSSQAAFGGSLLNHDPPQAEHLISGEHSACWMYFSPHPWQ